jgi:hypothetical protein
VSGALRVKSALCKQSSLGSSHRTCDERKVSADRRPIARSARHRALEGLLDASCTWLTCNRRLPKGKGGSAMASDLTRGKAAVLAFSRELRRAISAREETTRNALHAYDRAVGDRLDHATTFFRAVQRADSAYESSLQEALECFQERIDQGDGE